MREKLKLEIIRNFCKNKITVLEASNMLNCTSRNINLLREKYLSNGYSAFIHKNKGRISKRKYPDELTQKIIDLYLNKYSNFNIRHFKEMLESETTPIVVSYDYIKNILAKNSIYSPRIYRSTKIRLKQEILKKQLNNKRLLSEEKCFLNNLQNKKQCI